MRIFTVTLILILNTVLSSTVLRHIAIFGVMPNLTIIIVSSFALLRSDVEGAVIGFFAGLLQDVMFGRNFGLNALFYMIIGYFCGKPFKDFYRENYLLPLFLILCSTFFYEFGFYITNFLFRSKLDVLYYLGKIIIPSLFYNAFLTIPVFRIMYSINYLLEKRENPMRKLF